MRVTVLSDGTTEFDDEAFWVRWRTGTLQVQEIISKPCETMEVKGVLTSPYRPLTEGGNIKGNFVVLVIDSPENRKLLEPK
jgi:hypothetical protein